jgi:hypothetical protein
LQGVIIRYLGAVFHVTYLGCELHSNSRPFPVFDAERAHNGISIFIQTAHFKHRVDAKTQPVNTGSKALLNDYSLCFFLFERYRRWLSQFRGEEQRFAHGCLSQMCVHLLNIPSVEASQNQHKSQKGVQAHVWAWKSLGKGYPLTSLSPPTTPAAWRSARTFNRVV